MMAGETVTLRAVLYRDDGLWFAHCLEMDLIGHGDSREEALNQLQAAIQIQIEESARDRGGDNLFFPAEPEYFRMFFAGRHRAVFAVAFSFDPPLPPEEGGLDIDGIEYSEYEKNQAVTA